MALLRQMTCNLRHPTSLRRPVSSSCTLRNLYIYIYKCMLIYKCKLRCGDCDPFICVVCISMGHNLCISMSQNICISMSHNLCISMSHNLCISMSHTTISMSHNLYISTSHTLLNLYIYIQMYIDIQMYFDLRRL